MLPIIIITISVALLFDFFNGMNDAANSIATIISTRVLPPLLAVIWAAFFNFAAAFFFGVHVANTIGKGIIEPSIMNEYIILSGLIGAILWVFICVRIGMPISVSHSLIGGLLGPAILVGGKNVVIAAGLTKILIFIVLAPLTGIIISYFLMISTLHIFQNSHPRKVDSLFRIMQLLSSAVFSIGHGSNDAQKTMGIIAILLFSSGRLGTEFYVPTWTIFTCYATIALGTIAGGRKTIKTLGTHLTHLKPVQGFCAETAGAIAIIGSTLGGVPVSTTQTITGSIMGVGLTRRASSIRWGLATNILIAWVSTIPVTMFISGGIYLIISIIIKI